MQSQPVAGRGAAFGDLNNDGAPDVVMTVLGGSQAAGRLSKNTFDTLLANFPNSARAHQSLGDAYAAERRAPEAEKEYREALRLRPNLPGAHLSLGIVYADAAQWDKAEGEFRAEAQLQPGNAEAAYRLGSALLQAGKASRQGTNWNARTACGRTCRKRFTRWGRRRR